MSYTKIDAMQDTNDIMISALNSDDMTYVAEVAQMLAGIAGWEEEVLTLRNIVRKSDEDYWAYDESIGN
jgi:hypothetical protein